MNVHLLWLWFILWKPPACWQELSKQRVWNLSRLDKDISYSDCEKDLSCQSRLGSSVAPAGTCLGLASLSHSQPCLFSSAFHKSALISSVFCSEAHWKHRDKKKKRSYTIQLPKTNIIARCVKKINCTTQRNMIQSHSFTLLAFWQSLCL